MQCVQCVQCYLDAEVDGIESLLEVVLLHAAGDVGEVERGGGRVDVLVVLAAGLLEPANIQDDYETA